MREDIKINNRALALQDQIIEKLEKVFDTDVELDVYNLGLIYEINLDETGLCKIVMTFTDTACDCAESLPIEIVAGLKQIEGIEDVKVEVTWSPAWKITRISRYGRILDSSNCEIMATWICKVKIRERLRINRTGGICHCGHAHVKGMKIR